MDLQSVKHDKCLKPNCSEGYVPYYNINDIDSYDYFNIIQLCKSSKYNELKQIIINNNIDICDYYFLRDICMLNNKELIQYIKDELQVDFTMGNYGILQYLAFVGNIDMLNYMFTLYNCYDEFMTKINYSSYV